MNSTTNDATGFSLNKLRYAVKPRSLADLVLPIEGMSDSAERLEEELRNRRDEARDSIVIAQRKQRKYFNAKRQDKQFEVGDLVILKLNRFGPGYKAPKPHDHKLAPIGTPLRIIEKLSPLSYRLSLPKGTKMHDIVSIVHLRRYRGSGRDLRPLPVMVEGSEEFEVERIDGERVNSLGGKEYLVKWYRYADKERTWEPLTNLEHADTVIAEWHSRNPDKPTRPPKLPKPNPSVELEPSRTPALKDSTRVTWSQA